MALNQNRKIRVYLLVLASIGSFVFLVFLVSNFFSLKNNAAFLETMHKRDFPLIEQLIALKNDAGLLKELYEDAIAYENEFLILEATEQKAVIERRLLDIEHLIGGFNERTAKIRKALGHYSVRAEKLAVQLIEDVDNLEQFELSANQVNEAFLALNQAITSYLRSQQDSYAFYLRSINDKLKRNNLAASTLGLLLVLLMFGFTLVISNLIIKVVKSADAVKEAFLLTVSHELRTPLNGIKGALDLLLSPQSLSQKNELIAIARASSLVMSKTVEDIILFAELISGIPKPTIRLFNLGEAVLELIEFSQARCAEKGLVFRFEPEYSCVELASDEKKIVYVIRHLLDNAIKYSSQGTIVLTIKNTIADHNQAEHQLNITVCDEGKGIDEAYLECLYEPFKQEQTSWSREFQGIGLGLPVCQMLVKSLGGQLIVKNREDIQGVQAQLIVPVRPALSHIQGTKLEQPEHTQVELMGLDRSGRILIVEDNISNQLILKRCIENLGFSAAVASDGSQALELLKEEEFLMVFMDCQMPVMDGFEATKAIRSGVLNQQVPIVAITANTRDVDREKCFEAGMNGFLEKPINLKAVENFVGRYLRAG